MPGRSREEERVVKIQKAYRILPSTVDWIKKGAKARGLGVGDYLDLVATWPVPGSVKEEVAEKSTTPETPERMVLVAEELELPNGLLKIVRDPEEDGLPVAFVRSRVSDGWKRVDWKRLHELDVEVQGLKRDKLAEEVKRIRATRVKIETRLPPGAQNILAMEKDVAEPQGHDFPKWCMNCKVTVESPEELEEHRRVGHSVRELEPGELWRGGSRQR